MLKRVIGLVQDITQRVGRVLQMGDCQTGGDNNTVESKPLPAFPLSKRKRKRVNKVIREQSLLQETLLVPTLINQSQGIGIPLAALALQSAKSKPNNKQSPVQPTTQEASSNKGKLPALAETGEAGKQRRIPAKGIVQRAKRANKLKP